MFFLISVKNLKYIHTFSKTQGIYKEYIRYLIPCKYFGQKGINLTINVN